MPTTLNPACPLCGLRFGNRPLLDLHIREDHRQRVPGAQNGHRDPGSSRAAAPRADSPPRGHDVPPTPSRTMNAATARTARRRPRAGQAISALRRALRALRYGNDAFLRASEAVIRSPSAHRSPARRRLCLRPGNRGQPDDVPLRHALSAKLALSAGPVSLFDERGRRVRSWPAA